MLATGAFSYLERPGLLQTALGAVCLTLLWFVISSFFAWSKLRHVPGPFLASFSHIWEFRATYSGRFCQILDEAHKKHGEVVRVGPDAISIFHPETFFRINSVRSVYTRGPWHKGVRIDHRGDSILTELDIAKYTKRKAKLTPGFGGKNIALIETKLDKWLGVLIRGIRAKIEKGEEIMDFGTLARYFQVDLISEISTGRPWGDLVEEKDHFGFLEMADRFIPALEAFAFIPAARAIFTSAWFMKLFGPKITDTKGLGVFLGILEKEVNGRFRDEADRPKQSRDMLDIFIEHGLPATECQLDLALLMPAGTENTATAVRGTLLLLMSSPAAYNKVKQEIKNSITAGRISEPVTGEEARSLKYTQAVVREGMRLMVPVVFGFPRRVPPTGDTICGIFIPGGTDVYMNFYSMMHRKDVFGDDAQMFRPERWLSDGPNTVRMVKVVDQLFGGGRFTCLGKTLALLELNKVFIELLRNFDFQVATPEKPWGRIGHTTWTINDFWTRVTEDTTMHAPKDQK
ncbi:cytochrome P450 [Nemania sp. NC0429]|nr:cytochrome P450 [Nemania sp. NC0429]